MTDLSEEDNALFIAAIKGTMPLKQISKHSSPRPSGRPPSLRCRSRECGNSDLSTLSFLSDADLEAAVGSEESLWFIRGALPHLLVKKFRKGELPLRATLDLHGCFVVEARQAIQHFIHNCHQQHIRCALIIHGKGYRASENQPILKNKVNQWLRQLPEVLAFCSAKSSHGGTGAVYVLVKTARQ